MQIVLDRERGDRRAEVRSLHGARASALRVGEMVSANILGRAAKEFPIALFLLAQLFTRLTDLRVVERMVDFMCSRIAKVRLLLE